MKMNRWIPAIAGTIILLFAGLVYAWSTMSVPIAQEYPRVEITFLVRGGPAANDACRADAEYMGVPFPVLDTGSKIAGAHLGWMAEDAQRAVDEADIILSKGQANVETLYDTGHGYNIYYAFLVKCGRFIRRFGKEKLTPMLLHESGN